MVGAIDPMGSLATDSQFQLASGYIGAISNQIPGVNAQAISEGNGVWSISQKYTDPDGDHVHFYSK